MRPTIHSRGGSHWRQTLPPFRDGVENGCMHSIFGRLEEQRERNSRRISSRSAEVRRADRIQTQPRRTKQSRARRSRVRVPRAGRPGPRSGFRTKRGLRIVAIAGRLEPRSGAAPLPNKAGHAGRHDCKAPRVLDPGPGTRAPPARNRRAIPSLRILLKLRSHCNNCRGRRGARPRAARPIESQVRWHRDRIQVTCPHRFSSGLMRLLLPTTAEIGDRCRIWLHNC
jgi:hypothetical protein